MFQEKVTNVSLIDLPAMGSSRISSLNTPYYSLFQSGIDPKLYQTLDNDFSSFLSNDNYPHPCIASNGTTNPFCNFLTRKLMANTNFKTVLEILKESYSHFDNFHMNMKEDPNFTEKFVKNSTIFAKLAENSTTLESNKLLLDLSPRRTQPGTILFCDFIQSFSDIKYEVNSLLG
jgi:hypothetical protein